MFMAIELLENNLTIKRYVLFIIKCYNKRVLEIPEGCSWVSQLLYTFEIGIHANKSSHLCWNKFTATLRFLFDWWCDHCTGLNKSLAFKQKNGICRIFVGNLGLGLMLIGIVQFITLAPASSWGLCPYWWHPATLWPAVDFSILEAEPGEESDRHFRLCNSKYNSVDSIHYRLSHWSSDVCIAPSPQRRVSNPFLV